MAEDKGSMIDKRSINTSKMQKTTDYKSDLDDDKMGMIGEFLKQEDTKEIKQQGKQSMPMN